MHLLTSTANDLHSLMGAVTKDEKSAENVKVAAECGKQIISTMRLKLDAMKFAKELKNQGGFIS